MVSLPSSFNPSKAVIMLLGVAADHPYLVDRVIVVRDRTLNEEFGS